MGSAGSTDRCSTRDEMSLESAETMLFSDVNESSSLSKEDNRWCCDIVDEEIEEEGEGLRGKLSGLNGGTYRT